MEGLKVYAAADARSTSAFACASFRARLSASTYSLDTTFEDGGGEEGEREEGFLPAASIVPLTVVVLVAAAAAAAAALLVVFLLPRGSS